MTTKSRTTKYWPNPALNFKRHSIPTRISNYVKSTNKIFYTPPYIERWVEQINWFYNRSSYNGKSTMQGKRQDW